MMAIHYKRIGKLSLVVALMFFLSCSDKDKTPQDQKKLKSLASYKFLPGSHPASRISAPPPFVLSFWAKADNRKNYSAYLPTDAEKKRIRSSMESLPPRMRRALDRGLIGIYFINHFLSNGMTDWVVGPNGQIYVYMIFHPRTLKMDLAGLITQKERTAFQSDASQRNLRIETGKAPGILYILLHEAFHALDYMEELTPYVEDGLPGRAGKKGWRHTVYTMGLWKSYRQTARHYDFRKKVAFYGMKGGPHMKLSMAEARYRELVASPFVSLYGSLNWAEDAAELATFYHLSERMGYPFRIVLEDQKAGKGTEGRAGRGAKGNSKVYEPMRGKKVRQRFPALQNLYQ